jgi:hypothetical protein
MFTKNACAVIHNDLDLHCSGKSIVLPDATMPNFNLSQWVSHAHTIFQTMRDRRNAIDIGKNFAPTLWQPFISGCFFLGQTVYCTVQFGRTFTSDKTAYKGDKLWSMKSPYSEKQISFKLSYAQRSLP